MNYIIKLSKEDIELLIDAINSSNLPTKRSLGPIKREFENILKNG